MTADRVFRSGRAVGASRRPTGPVASSVLVIGACLLVASAIIHLHLWAHGYRYVPSIGQLFFAQGVVGILLAIIISLIRRIFVAVLGALFAAGTIAGLLVSVHVGLFGYRESMSAPWVTTTLVIEAAAVVMLVVGGVLAVSIERSHIRRWRSLKLPTSP